MTIQNTKNGLKKLQGVYATQSKEIQDAYTSIATGQ